MKIQKSKKETFCEPCIMAKFPRDFSRVLDSRSNIPFHQLYMDLSGPVHHTTDFNYLFAIVDDFSSYIVYVTKVKFLKYFSSLLLITALMALEKSKSLGQIQVKNLLIKNFKI